MATARQQRRAPTLADIARHLDLDDSDPDVTRRVAAHEAGHAIVATALGASRVVRMTLLRDGGETVRRQADRIGTWDDILDELATHLAGRAAERLLYGNVSAGAGGGPASDLAIATELAVACHMRLGLGWRGPVWSEAPIELALRDPQIHDRVRQMLIDAEDRAKKVLETEHKILNDLSEHLFKRRRLSGSDLDDLLGPVQRISRQTT